MTYEKKQEKNKLTYHITVKPQEFDKYLSEALASLAKELDLKGFRKGNVPLHIAEKHLDETQVLSEASNHCIEEKWLEIIDKEDIEAISAPLVNILKIAKGNPFEFEVEIEILPEVNLPDYKEIAKTVKSEQVKTTKKDFDKALKMILQANAKLSQKDGPAEKGDFIEIAYSSDTIKERKDGFILGQGQLAKGIEDDLIGLKKGDKKQITVKEKQRDLVLNVSVNSVQKVELPELSPEFVKNMGFKTKEDFEKHLKEELQKEKEIIEKQRKKEEVLESIKKQTKLDVPITLIEREQQALLENLKNRVSYELQISFEEYLKQAQKTEDQLKKGFEDIAKERVKGFLILHAIEKKENITVTKEEIDEKSKDKDQNLRYYIEDQLKKEKIFNILGC